MKKTSVAIALYFSSNRDRVPDGYLNDYLFVYLNQEKFVLSDGVLK